MAWRLVISTLTTRCVQCAQLLTVECVTGVPNAAPSVSSAQRRELLLHDLRSMVTIAQRELFAHDRAHDAERDALRALLTPVPWWVRACRWVLGA